MEEGLDPLDLKVEPLRLNLLKTYTELKELIIEAHGGIEPAVNLMGTVQGPIILLALFENPTTAFHAVKSVPAVLETTIAYWGGKRIRLNPFAGQLEDLFMRVGSDTRLPPSTRSMLESAIDTFVRAKQESDFKQVALAFRNVLIEIEREVCQFDEISFRGIDVSPGHEKNRLIAYLIVSGISKVEAENLIHQIWDIGSKGKRAANKEEVLFQLLLTHLLLHKIGMLNGFSPLKKLLAS